MAKKLELSEKEKQPLKEAIDKYLKEYFESTWDYDEFNNFPRNLYKNK